MAALHTALKSLSAIDYSDVPSSENDLDAWISDLFVQCELILDSIPIGSPSNAHGSISHSSTSIASNASEMTVSSARSAPPVAEHEALQKTWGKPVKLGSKENSLGMSVYKLGGKDGKGAWFARHSVHEGLPFSQFKKAMEMEFPESLAVHGAPGEGNVRGIGGETRVENVKVPGKGRVEVYRLSAQFPGPTTPRDFVTLLVTSENAVKSNDGSAQAPRHYMIISKPCNHPATQPQNGFIRGFYESVEFIREVPRKVKSSYSTTDLAESQRHKGTISKDAMIRNAHQRTDTSTSTEATHDTDGASLQRSSTSPARSRADGESEDRVELDDNPVEWIMVTRSDPGGSVPRFMVERGTPSSICADAEKFLDWACQQDFSDQQTSAAKDELPVSNLSGRRESFQSFRSTRMAGVNEYDPTLPPTDEHPAHNEEPAHEDLTASAEGGHGGLFGVVSGAAHYLSSYTPQVVLDHLPGNRAPTPDLRKENVPALPRGNEDNVSIVSKGTFESADSHFTMSESEAESHEPKNASEQHDHHLTRHEKELQKLEERKAALETKFLESRTKLELENSEHSAREEQAVQKAKEKYEKELNKQKQKYEKELRKLEQRKEKEKKKMKDKKRKQDDKDEKSRLTRERDEARQELDLARKEADVLRNVVEELQKENTTLVTKLGRAGLTDLSDEEGKIRKSSSSRRLVDSGRVGTGSTTGSIRSQ